MIEPQNIDKLYQRIGEFTVSFQWMEHRFREIGWLINDPERKNYPPLILREESNKQLLDKVMNMFSGLMDNINTEYSLDMKRSFKILVKKAHEIREYRNILLHSAFFELKAGRGVIAIMRSNPKLKSNEEGEYTFDSEILTEAAIQMQMKELAQLALEINSHYFQLIHWLPI